MIEDNRSMVAVPACPFDKIHPSELLRDDAYFMSLAFNRGIDAWNADEVPVGAIIVHKENIIASAHNQVESLHDPTAHAEMLAISQASEALGDWRLNEACLYVTKEPCPMCSGAAIMSRLGRVVFGVRDPKMGMLGGVEALHEIQSLNHHLLVTPGIMEAECKALLQAYFQFKRSGATVPWN